MTSWPFILATFILLLNDSYLKYAFHNALTGKLSDFAGIFMVAAIFGKWLPTRKIAIFSILSIVFLWWKSPYSQGFIGIIQNTIIPSFNRTVDYTDCIALLTIPLALIFADQSHRFSFSSDQWNKGLRFPILLVTAFAIMGTSTPGTIRDYKIRATEDTPNFSRKDISKTLQSIVSELGYGCRSSNKEGGCDVYGDGEVSIMLKIIDQKTVGILVMGDSNNSLFSPDNGEDNVEEVRKILIKNFSINFKGLEFIEILE